MLFLNENLVTGYFFPVFVFPVSPSPSPASSSLRVLSPYLFSLNCCPLSSIQSKKQIEESSWSCGDLQGHLLHAIFRYHPLYLLKTVINSSLHTIISPTLIILPYLFSSSLPYLIYLFSLLNPSIFFSSHLLFLSFHLDPHILHYLFHIIVSLILVSS